MEGSKEGEDRKNHSGTRQRNSVSGGSSRDRNGSRGRKKSHHMIRMGRRESRLLEAETAGNKQGSCADIACGERNQSGLEEIG